MSEQPRERGAAIVLVAFALIFLCGMAAVVVDVGFARQVRRQAQNAADAGALAAVVDYTGSPATENASRARALEYVEDNGFSSANSTVSASFLTNAAGDPYVRVTISNRSVPTSFGKIIGVSSLNVGAGSTACQPEGNVTLPGLFAGGTCTGPGKGMVLSGNDNRIEGGLHSNVDAKENGNNNTRVSGFASYVTNPVDISGSGVHWWTGATQTSSVPWPIAFDIADFAPGGSRAVAAGSNYYSFTGDQPLVNVALPAGIYYTTGKWELTGVTVTPFNGKTGATFVSSDGLIDLKGNNNIRPYWASPRGWSSSPPGMTARRATSDATRTC
ncbi:MAG: pilus assembly protein TadG-related protein [Acidimicrobiia bacterium]